jgi:hypothetical protein
VALVVKCLANKCEAELKAQYLKKKKKKKENKRNKKKIRAGWHSDSPI